MFRKTKQKTKETFHIFLDVDGVLNKESDWKVKYVIDKACVQNLAQLCRALEGTYQHVYIILCSTWRAGVSRTGESIQISELKKVLKENGLEISGTTPVSDKGRQAEVEYFIQRNGVEDYLVIDDDESMFYNPDKINLYAPNYKTGLTKKDVDQIVKGM